MAGPYYVDNANGSDGSDGLSEGNAFATLEKAADTVLAGEIVYVQGGTSYTVQDGANAANLFITAVATETAPILWIGYTTTITDNGRAVIDAGSGWANVIKGDTGYDKLSWYTFKNFRITGGTNVGVEGRGSNQTIWENCRIDNNGAQGLHLDNNNTFVNCEIDNNTTGVDNDISGRYIACKFHDNSGYAIIAQYGLVFACEFYNNGSGCVQFVNIVANGSVINCTMDGDDNTGIGIYFNDASGVANALTIINNIFHDLATGIESSTNDYSSLPMSQRVIVKNNLFNSNTVNATKMPTGEDAIIDSVPVFTNEAGRDYTLAAGSPAIDAGYDAGSMT